jgi:hypothetical protein
MTSPVVAWWRIPTMSSTSVFTFLPASGCLTTNVSLLVSTLKVKVKVVLRPKISRPVCLCVKHPSEVQGQIFITVRQLRMCWCGAPSLRRGRICRLQLLLVLASTVILGSDSCRTHDHILLSQLRDSHNLENQVPVFISLRDRVVQLHSQALGSLFVSSYNWVVGLRWRYSNPPLRGVVDFQIIVLLITSQHGQHRKHRSYVAVSNCCLANMLLCEAVTQ